MSEVKLIALDLDGTLFNDAGIITPANREAISYAASRGVHVVISTGRPFSGLPFEQIEGLPIHYAITTNGASAVHLPDGECLFEDTMPNEIVLPMLRYLVTKTVHIAIFIQGKGFTPESCRRLVPDLIVSDHMKEVYFPTRRHVPDICSYLASCGHGMQKMTLNFVPDENGQLIDRAEIEAHLKAMPEISVVCGGYQNLEVTNAGIDKGRGLRLLAKQLGLDISETMAIGDAGNDLAIIKAAGIGICMANGEEPCLAAADYITASNEEDGVAKAIYHFVN